MKDQFSIKLFQKKRHPVSREVGGLMSSVKKVAIFITSLRGGGAERIVSYLLKEGCSKYEFHLILLHEEVEYSLPQTANVKVVKLDGGATSKYVGVLKTPILGRRLKEYLIDNNIPTLLTLLNRPNLIGCYVKKSGWGGKLIISERADTLAYYGSIRFGTIMTRLVKHYYRYADVVTVISKGIARSLQSLGIPKCKVIYNPVYISPCQEGERSNGSNFTFINIGRLEPQKNQALLLRAFAELPNNNCRLVIVGRGYLLGQLEELATSLGIESRVTFAGFQTDVRSWLNKSDCFVFSSDYEGFGNVIVEAMNLGVPVISTDCPHGPREILAPDTGSLIENGIESARYGLLTPVASVVHLAEAMQQMMANAALRTRYRKLSPERAADFDVNKISQQYFELF